MTKLRILSFALLFFSLASASQVFSQSVPSLVFPDPLWHRGKLKNPASLQALKKMESIAFPPLAQASSGALKPIETDTLLVIKRGKIVYERHANGFQAHQRHYLWSVTKSFLNLFLGIAVKEGKMKLKDSICSYLPTALLKKKEFCAIKVQHVAQHTTGIKWIEEYENSSALGQSSVLTMHYGSGPQNLIDFIIRRHSLAHRPGNYWFYSSGDSALLGSLLRQAYGAKEFSQVVHRVFQKLGIKTALWEKDHTGLVMGAAYLFISPMDMARFGHLYLAKGSWKGESILDSQWIEFSTKPSQAFAHTHPIVEHGRPPKTYGAHWWLNHPHPRWKPKERPWPDLPPDTFAAIGHWGQYVVVIPSRQTLLVRTGNDRGEEPIDLNALVKYALEMVENE